MREKGLRPSIDLKGAAWVRGVQSLARWHTRLKHDTWAMQSVLRKVVSNQDGPHAAKAAMR